MAKLGAVGVSSSSSSPGRTDLYRPKLHTWYVSEDLEIYANKCCCWVASGWARWGGPWAVAGQGSLAQASGSLELANGGLRALDEARKANFTFQRNLSIYVVLGARSAGWAGLGILTGQERPVAGQGKPRARKRWTESPGRGQESQFYADPRVRCAWLAGQASGLQLAR